jgi:hypothetical protein
MRLNANIISCWLEKLDLQTGLTPSYLLYLDHADDEGADGQATEEAKKKRPAARVYTKREREDALAVSCQGTVSTSFSGCTAQPRFCTCPACPCKACWQQLLAGVGGGFACSCQRNPLPQRTLGST